MLFSSELVALVLYSLQQFGIMLGVGAETILLAVFLVSLHKAAAQPTEARFANTVRRALYIGLGTVVFSGVGIVAYHLELGQGGVVLQPAFLFKWLIIVLLLLAALARPRGVAFSLSLWEGAVGSAWYALFLVHVLAPVTSWPILLGIFGVWLAGFEACWWALAHAMRGGTDVGVVKKVSSPIPVLKPHPLPIPKPETSLLVLQRQAVATAPVPHKPAPAPVPRKPYVMPAIPIPQKPAVILQKEEQPPDLPALHIMPRTPQEVSNQFRGAVVEFKQT